MQKNEGGMIICYGDSNTYGYDPCVPGGGRYSEKEQWTTLVEAKTGIPVKNYGLCWGQMISPVPVKQGAWVESEQLCWETHRLSDFYRAISKKLGIDFADAGEWNIPLAYDGVHFTEEGHGIFAENIMKYIK